VAVPSWGIQSSKGARVMLAAAGIADRSKAKSPRRPPLLRPIKSWSRAPEFQLAESPRMKVAAWV